MKVKFANKVFEVLYTMESAGLTMYAVEDEPNHIDWLTNVEVVDDEKKELKKIDNETEIPFGAKDSELQGATYYIPKGFHAEIDGDKVVIKKGEKPTAWSEEDEGILDEIIDFLENGTVKLQHDLSLYASWLKSLKGRVGCEANCTTTKEWSVEDMSKIQRMSIHR
jgi:hypothetical protein